MKNIISILTMLFAVLIVNAQLQNEDFASTTIPTGWTATNTTSCSWQFGYTGIMPGSGGAGNEASSPTGAALFHDSTCGALSHDRAIITGPTVDLTGVTNAEIVVIYNLQVFGNKGEFIIEAYDGTSWQQVYFQDIDTPRNTGLNQSVTVDVSTQANNNSAFAIRFIYDDEEFLAIGLSIDNYILNDNTTTGINQLANFGFEYSPNPVANVLKLKAKEKIEQIKVYNVRGQNVMNHKPLRNSARLNMSNLAVGSYIVHVQINGKLGSFKVLKQ
ncbi:MAG: T9SS type A sorting domain-containing protein [Flavobacteriaceae bacterium]|nr:T9SS type A sorting domain-containing protein [Flavobacteriaceae bacterium]